MVRQPELAQGWLLHRDFAGLRDVAYMRVHHFGGFATWQIPVNALRPVRHSHRNFEVARNVIQRRLTVRCLFDGVHFFPWLFVIRCEELWVID